MSIDAHKRSPTAALGRSVTAVLGPTNTGKTHLAIERMLGHQSGLIGLPLRLLAREVYDRIVGKVGASQVALITGEERIKPANPRFYVSTVEAMPRDLDVDFLAIDEIQLAADPERGHVFTDRLLSARGQSETLLLGSLTIKPLISQLLPGSNSITRPRLSKLTYSGMKKLTRLPRRTAIVAFSANEVYEIAELIRRQRGGAAVVMGALSPRTRNAQVELYQSGDVDFLIATDAIGMGLNLDVNHVAFAATRKFDGQLHRELTPAELSQIAGRAGRHMNDGTFGVTGNVDSFDSELITQLETHEFPPLKILQWRNSDLDYSSLQALKDSLSKSPNQPNLTRARLSDDVIALENVSLDANIKSVAIAPAAIRKLWDICQIPDYRKISSASHADLVKSIYKFAISDAGHIPDDWISEQVEQANRTDGDIDTLSTRISHIRTWTFISNRPDLLDDPVHWQQKTREIEDRLSDALHEQLLKRFVDQRTSILMKRLRDEDEMFAEITKEGKVYVEKHYVGELQGFKFTPDNRGDGIRGKAARNAAAKILTKELAMRTRRISSAKSTAFELARNGTISWNNEVIANLEAGEDPLKPGFSIRCDEHLTSENKEKISTRLQSWIDEQLQEKLQPLLALQLAEDVSGLARGIAYRLKENFGIIKREEISEELKSLNQTERAQLRKFGVRFGAFNIYFPILLKPASSDLRRMLWILQAGEKHGYDLQDYPEPPKAGLTSVLADRKLPQNFYLISGYKVCGSRAVRIDMLERLADMIRPLTSWRSVEGKEEKPPEGATGDGGFVIQPGMMSILGCSADELGEILSFLSFKSERRKKAAQSDASSGKSSREGDDQKSSDADQPEAVAESAAEQQTGKSDLPGDDPKVEASSTEAQEQPHVANSELSAASQETAEESTQTKSEAAVADAIQGPADDTRAKSDGEPENTSPDKSDSPVDAGNNEASAEEAEEEFELIWRPVRRKPVRAKRPGTGRKAQTPHRKAKSSAPRKQKAKQSKPRRAEKKVKPFDPNSPFAALKKLKDDLESQNTDRQ